MEIWILIQTNIKKVLYCQMSPETYDNILKLINTEKEAKLKQ